MLHSAHPSVPCLQFSRNNKAAETTNLVETLHWATVTRASNLMSKGQRSKIKSLQTKI